MIPLSDDNPVRRKPYATYTIIGINIIIFLIDYFTGKGPIGGLWNLSMVPASVMNNIPVDVPVARDTLGRILTMSHNGLNPQWLTIFTSMFMHGGFLHIGGNMLYLWIFGNNIEDILGRFWFVIFYLLSGVLAALFHIASNPQSVIPTVAPSGAIAGVLGAYLILFPHARVRTLVLLWIVWDYVEIPAILVLGVWFLTQILNLGGAAGHGGGVAYWAHVGGFISGIVLILLMGGKSKAKRRGILVSYDDWEFRKKF